MSSDVTETLTERGITPSKYTKLIHGVGVDGVYLAFHKANQFLGMQSLPTFIVNDVIKMPDVPSYIEAYKAHLDQLFATAH